MPTWVINQPDHLLSLLHLSASHFILDTHAYSSLSLSVHQICFQFSDFRFSNMQISLLIHSLPVSGPVPVGPYCISVTFLHFVSSPNVGKYLTAWVNMSSQTRININVHYTKQVFAILSQGLGKRVFFFSCNKNISRYSICNLINLWSPRNKKNTRGNNDQSPFSFIELEQSLNYLWSIARRK